MPIARKLIGLGLPWGTAAGVVGQVDNNLTAAGTTQATALAIGNDINVVTTAAASTGVILRSDLAAGDSQEVVNYGANTLTVYPPVGGKINNGSANAGVTIATNTSALYTSIDGLNFFGVKSA
jgi:hypothetical protein